MTALRGAAVLVLVVLFVAARIEPAYRRSRRYWLVYAGSCAVLAVDGEGWACWLFAFAAAGAGYRAGKWAP